MTNPLALHSPNALFNSDSPDGNVRSSVGKFVRWLDTRGLHWATVDLKDYRDYLLGLDIRESTAQKHMQRVRSRYKDMLHSNAVRDAIQAQIPPDATPADIFSTTEEFLRRIENNSQYDKRLAITLKTDIAHVDSDFTWLTFEEIDQVIRSLELSGALVYRDAAALALLASFGLREAEACDVTVENLRETKRGKPGVLVEDGKGKKRGFVYLDELTDWTPYIWRWCEYAGITSGKVLQAFGNQQQKLAHATLTPRQLSNRVHLWTGVSPHNLRRSYAKILYNGGRDVDGYIRQQLRHSRVETTLRYIGFVGKDDRR